ncbi:MAG: hypothetical protein AAF573_05100 [Bacteroidota bacterium]
MKKEIAFTLKLLFPILLFSQNQLPKKILVKYYVGGDYRSEQLEINGAYDNIDSTFLKIRKDGKAYKSEQIEIVRRIYPYEDGFQKNIRMDSTYRFLSSTTYYVEDIEELLEWTDIENYEIWNSQDSFMIDQFYHGVVRDTFLIPLELSIEDFGIDSIDFDLHCNYFYTLLSRKLHMEKEDLLDCSKISPSNFLNLVLNDLNVFYTVSSYLSRFHLKLIYPDFELEFYQRYPKQLNFTWYIQKDGKLLRKVFNPYLNQIIYNGLPSVIRILKFDEVRIRESLFNSILIKN